MALPSAQLGALSSLNGPSYVPTVVVPKEPKYWEKILMQTLANAGSQVVSQGISNTMSKDYADTTAGEKPNTGFSKFWQGPKVGEKEHAMRASDKRFAKETEFADSRLQKQLDAAAGMETKRQSFQREQSNADRMDANMRDMQRFIGDTTERERDRKFRSGESAAERESMKGLRESMTKENESRARMSEQQAAQMAQQLALLQKTLAGQQAEATPPPTPTFRDNQEALITKLQAEGVPVDQILNQVRSMQPPQEPTPGPTPQQILDLLRREELQSNAPMSINSTNPRHFFR